MESTRPTFSTQYYGNQSSYTFDGRSAVRDIKSATISRITVMHDAYVSSLTVHYTGEAEGTLNGGGNGTQVDVVLKAGEFITVVEGQALAGGSCISQLTFLTNLGTKWGPYGSYTGTQSFTFNGATLVGTDMARKMGLLYFSGSHSGAWITRLQATFTRYVVAVNKPKVVLYEEEAQDIRSCAPAGLSKFALTLMSPIATLHVGPDDIVFRAYEDTLCRLPFFRAALLGKFKEASEKKVTMPEDDPEIVSALIQFLYDGNYTYTFKTTAEVNKDEEAPPVDLREGMFHSRVYALATKYDCQPLVDAAKESLVYVLKGLEGIDVVRLLKETYDRGWSIPEWEKHEDMVDFRQGLGKLLKELFVSNREDMELIISECPAMAKLLAEPNLY